MNGPIASSFQRFPFHLTPSLVSQPWPATSLTHTSMPFLVPQIKTFFIYILLSPFSIISVSSHTAVLSRPDSGRDKIKERPPPIEGGTWFGFFFKLILLAGVVAGGYYGYQEYLRRQRYGGGFTDMFSSNSRYWMNVWSVCCVAKLLLLGGCPVLCIYLCFTKLFSFPFHRL